MTQDLKGMMMSDREYCRDCEHLTKLNTCNFPTPAWVDWPPVILNPNVARTCNTFSRRMKVREYTTDELHEMKKLELLTPLNLQDLGNE